MRQILGKNVRVLRTTAKLSQEELAVRMGVEQTYVSGIERGMRNPTITTLSRAAMALNAKVADLLKE